MTFVIIMIINSNDLKTWVDLLRSSICHLKERRSRCSMCRHWCSDLQQPARPYLKYRRKRIGQYVSSEHLIPVLGDETWAAVVRSRCRQVRKGAQVFAFRVIPGIEREEDVMMLRLTCPPYHACHCRSPQLWQTHFACRRRHRLHLHHFQGWTGLSCL